MASTEEPNGFITLARNKVTGQYGVAVIINNLPVIFSPEKARSLARDFHNHPEVAAALFAEAANAEKCTEIDGVFSTAKTTN